MSEAEAKRNRIRQKISASQARLKPEGPPAPRPLAQKDASPPDDLRSLAADYPLLTIAAGLGAGLLLGAVLPKAFGRKFASRAITAATIAGEIGLMMGGKAKKATLEAGSEGLHRLSDLRDETAEFRERALRLAGSVVGGARNSGITLAREAVRLAARARK